MGGDNNYRHIKGNLLQGKKKMTNFKRRPLLFMNTAHITEVKLWADIMSETSQKYQKLEGIVRYSNVCEGSLNVAHEAGAQQGKRDIERARTQTPSSLYVFRALDFWPFSFSLS